MRQVQVLRNNIWTEIDFNELKNGDKFKMFEPDGELVKYQDCTEFNAISDIYFNEKYDTLAIDIAETNNFV